VGLALTKPKRKAAAAKKSVAAAGAAEGAAADVPGDARVPAVGDGRVRAVIDAVLPAVDGGRFPVKRIAGDAVDVEAHCFADGHDKLGGAAVAVRRRERRV